jgi:oligoendopeptidase F
MSQELPLRIDIPELKTWDLSSIFICDEAWEEAFKALQDDLVRVNEFKGRLGESAETLAQAIKLQEDLSYQLGLLFVYAHLRFDTDTTNSTYAGYFSQIQGLYGQVLAAFSFYKSELFSNDEAKIFGYINEHPAIQHHEHDFRILFNQRAYTLSEKEERLLAEASEVMQAPSTIFGMLNNADIQFRKVLGEDGTLQTLSHGRY